MENKDGTYPEATTWKRWFLARHHHSLRFSPLSILEDHKTAAALRFWIGPMQLSPVWQWWHDQRIATFVLLDWTVVVSWHSQYVAVGDVSDPETRVKMQQHQGAKSHLHGPDKARLGVWFGVSHFWWWSSFGVFQFATAMSIIPAMHSHGFGWVFEDESWEKGLTSWLSHEQSPARERERAARKACCSTSSLVSHSCWLMTWVKGMNIPCASGNCRMAACFALTRTGRWQRACKGWKGKKRRSMLKSGYLPTIIFCSVVHSGSWFLLLFWWNALRFPQRLPSFSEDSSHLQIDSTSWHDICHTPGNPKTRHPCSDYWGESHTTGSPKWASSRTLAAGA